MILNKRGFRWMIFKLFGPPELKDLVSYLDEVADKGADIVIYPLGEFSFSVKSTNSEDLEPLIFPTPQERASFQHGLTYGVEAMGGEVAGLDKNEWETMKEMDRYSTPSKKPILKN